MRDEVLQRAFARSLEIIGEAAKNVPEEYRRQHSEVDWKSLAGLRDKLIHHYFGVDTQ
ncbi:MAG: HepT-like ribonuclease domain-containing protein [Patescibacteria group bacterium]